MFIFDLYQWFSYMLCHSLCYIQYAYVNLYQFKSLLTSATCHIQVDPGDPGQMECHTFYHGVNHKLVLVQLKSNLCRNAQLKPLLTTENTRT